MVDGVPIFHIECWYEKKAAGEEETDHDTTSDYQNEDEDKAPEQELPAKSTTDDLELKNEVNLKDIEKELVNSPLHRAKDKSCTGLQH